MATSRYSTSVSLCEDTSKNFELFDLLKQADPSYSAVDPARIKLYVYDGSKYVETTSGYFTAVDKDTFTVDASQLPNFNGELKVRVLGTDSTGNTFILDLSIDVTPVNDAPSGADESVNVASGDVYVLGINDFGFTDAVEGDAFKSVVITTLPVSGSLLLNGAAVIAGQEVSAADLAAGHLTYQAPANNGGAIGFTFQVRDTGGTDGCGGNDLDLTPNTITFNVPQPAKAFIGDTVWEDRNANGLQDAGETGIANVTVQLKDSNGNVVGTTTTDASGHYGFTVNPGTYTVAVIKPAGYEITAQDQGGNDTTDSDINAAGVSAPVTVGAGETNLTVDAGLYRTAELGDRVWYDTNKNGVQDAGEAGVQGVKVSLLDAGGNVVTTQTTDASGNYLFTGLKPGTYSVQFDKATLPAGYGFTTKDAGGDAVDSDADTGTGKTVQTVLDSGESDRTWDAGIVANPGSISGTVREDLDNNDTGDTPIPGVTIELKDSQGNLVATTTTDSNGNYSFNNVPPGTYTVVETNKPGYTDVGDIDGGNPNSISVTLPAGGTSSGNDFVDERPATLGDRVWEDRNANGLQDAGETGIANVTVQLKDSNGNVVGTTTTDANGNYSFSVTPGTYTVAVVKPAGYEITAQDQGGNDTTDSDINAAGVTAPVTLNSGENNPTIDAGLYRTAELGDRVWYDTNRNGVQDAGEAGVQGVKVSLLDAGGNVVTTQTTDASGNYLFTGLKPGTYSVQFDKTTLPAGYVFTTKDAGGDAVDSDADTGTGKTIQTVLDSGESDRSWDAGIVANPGSISGTVREDLDNNDTGDSPIAGVTVQLKDVQGNVVATTTTDANGNYLFSNLAPGSYTVVETNKPGYLDVNDVDGGNPNSIAVTLAPGASSTGNDFVDERSAAIGDKVWLDKNANGIQDAGEAGIAGVAVKLLDGNGSVVGTSTTDANGNYLFSNLAPGDYAVQIVAPTGYSVSPKDQGGNDATDSDIDPLTGKTITITLSAGETDLTWDAGLYQKASLGDRVWLDTNKNGVQDAGEAGVSGVTVKLLDGNGNVVATAATDASGNYLFKDLVPGNYAVQVVAPTGYAFAPKDQGTNDAVDSDVDGSGKSAVVALASGENNLTLDAGLVQNGASYGDRVWLDKNANGIQDAGEAGIAGVTVKLLNGAGTVVGTTTTDANGNYLFSNLTPGDYSAQIVAPTGYTISARDQGGNDATDSDFDPTTGKTITTTLTAGESDLSWDAGLYQKASLGDRVWLDTNKNGVQDAGEAGVKSVTVKLLDGNGTVVATTTTDANGNYKFSNLTPGDYAVQVVAPNGYAFSPRDQGTNDAVDSDVDATSGKSGVVTLASGENNTSLDAGIYCKPTTGSIGDRVWEDSNYNGIQDAGEAGIKGVTVKLLNSAGTVVATTTTDANGNYLFDNVAAGNYKVQVVSPSGYYVTKQDQGTSDATDSDINASGVTGSISLAAGDAITTVDAGLYKKASLGDKVWCDTDKDGIQDSGEAGVCGVTVKLLDSTGTVVATTTTDTNGNYKFSNLNPGNYAVQVVAPTGYVFSSKNQGTNDAVDSDVDASGKSGVVTLASGENNTSLDAGIYYKPATGRIGDRVWEDSNYNGIQDAGETGIKGVTVKLLNSAGTVVATTTTDASGNYLFSNVAAGNYKVQVVTPTGYYVTKQDQGTSDAADSDINASGTTGTISLSAGDAITTVDAGLYRKASIGDKVWEDQNHNSLQDSNEPGIANVKVMLQNAGGSTIATTYTDGNGNYKFTNLDPGSYRIVFDKSATVYKGVDMSTWYWAPKDVGSDDTRDADAYSKTDVAYTNYTTLVSGEADMTWDAGITPIVLDLDRNGIQTIARENSTGTFDLLGTGKGIHSGWISAGDAFLAVDLNGDGKITSVSELFGGYNKGDGFAKLADYDSNGDGVVDARDAAFGQLRVWQDLNGNHQTDEGELRSLSEAGVASLKVDFVELPAIDAQGNLHLERSSATLADGSAIDMADVYFNVSVADAKAAGVELPSLSALLGNDTSVDVALGATAAPVAASTAAATPCVVSDGAATTLSQLAHLYDEQQLALIAA